MGNSFEKLNRVPPSMPTIWQECNPYIRTMNMAQRGIYFSMMLHLWVYDTLPWDVWQMAKVIGSDYRTTAKLLQKCGDLAVCVRCSCGWRAETLRCPCSDLAVTVHNIKLRNYKIDVNLGLALGTTELNPTSTEPKGTPPRAAPSEREEEENSSPLFDEDFDQDKTDPNPLVEELVVLLGMVKPPVPKVYREWAKNLDNLVDGWSREKYQKGISYLFANAMYSRGIKKTGMDKVAWLCSKWEAMLIGMEADKEFGKKNSSVKAQDNRAGYLSKPSGKSGFGKSVI